MNACEITLVLDLDPLRLAGRGERAGLPLYPYVNDRPYLASSFLSVVRLLQGSLVYRDQRMQGFDAATLVEVIEHLDPPRLATMERVVFEFAAPKLIVVTTPNAEHNIQFATLPAEKLRHRDHRFEWRRHGKLTVIDATNVQKEARKPLLELAKARHVLAVVIVLDVPAEICQAHNTGRGDRRFGPHVIRQQVAQLKKSLRHLEAEGFRYRHVLASQEEVGITSIERQLSWSNRKWDHGPFDIIGDVHGCYGELVELLERLEYRFESDGGVVPPLGRKAVFLGDLVDRGPMARPKWSNWSAAW